MTLLARCRAMAGRPILERLRFYETLHDISLAEAAALVAAVDTADDAPWAGEVLARVVPGRFWLSADPENYDVRMLEDMSVWRRARWVDELVALREELPERVLPRLYEHAVHHAGVPSLAPHMPAIAALATHERRGVRHASAMIAILGPHVTPAVITALGEMLDDIVRDESGAYDEQVAGEELLGHIAAVGAPLAALAPQVAKLLVSESPAFRSAAAEAAGALGDASLVEPLLALVSTSNDDEFAISAVRAQARLSLWRLTGDVTHLDGALADAGDSIVYQMRISLALERVASISSSSSERLLAGVVRIAQQLDFYVAACDTLAALGPRAAAAMTAISPPPRPDMAHAYHHARWKTGHLDAAGLVAALQPLLDTSWHAWKPYVATNLGAPTWASTIRTHIIQGSEAIGGAVLDALGLAPDVAVRFVRELLVAGRGELVERIWRTHPRDFWNAVG